MVTCFALFHFPYKCKINLVRKADFLAILPSLNSKQQQQQQTLYVDILKTGKLLGVLFSGLWFLCEMYRFP